VKIYIENTNHLNAGMCDSPVGCSCVIRYVGRECGFSLTQSFLVGRLKVPHFLQVIFLSSGEISRKDSFLLCTRFQDRQSQFYHTAQILLHFEMH